MAKTEFVSERKLPFFIHVILYYIVLYYCIVFYCTYIVLYHSRMYCALLHVPNEAGWQSSQAMPPENEFRALHRCSS